MDNQPNQFHYAGLFSMTDDYWVKSTQKFQFRFFLHRQPHNSWLAISRGSNALLAATVLHQKDYVKQKDLFLPKTHQIQEKTSRHIIPKQQKRIAACVKNLQTVCVKITKCYQNLETCV